MSFVTRALLLAFIALCTGVVYFVASQFVLHLLIVNAVVIGGLGGVATHLLLSACGWQPSRTRTVIGFLTGVAAYLCRYYVLLVFIGGLQAIHRIDLVPWLIWDSFFHQQIVDQGVSVSSNIAVFIVESLVSGGMFAACLQLDRNLAPAAVCPQCKRGGKSKTALLPPGYASELRDALESGNWAELPADESNGEIEGDAWSSVTIEYCFHGGEGDPRLVLSAKETTFLPDGRSQVEVVFEPREISADLLLKVVEKAPSLAVVD